jgi:hypothetical protein
VGFIKDWDKGQKEHVQPNNPANSDSAKTFLAFLCSTTKITAISGAALRNGIAFEIFFFLRLVVKTYGQA